MPTSKERIGSWFNPGLVIAAILGVLLVALRLEGRRWWCACGQGFLWVSSAWSEHTSQHLFDPYTFTHFLHGFVFWWMLSYRAKPARHRWLFVAAVAIEVLWEIFENSSFAIERYRAATAAIGYSGDSLLNSLCDVMSCAAGFVAAQRLGWRWALIVFVLLELALGFWIRDGLTLNVLMLLCPNPALKAWQVGAGG